MESLGMMGFIFGFSGLRKKLKESSLLKEQIKFNDK